MPNTNSFAFGRFSNITKDQATKLCTSMRRYGQPVIAISRAGGNDVNRVIDTLKSVDPGVRTTVVGHLNDVLGYVSEGDTAVIYTDRTKMAPVWRSNGAKVVTISR